MNMDLEVVLLGATIINPQYDGRNSENQFSLCPFHLQEKNVWSSRGHNTDVSNK